MRPSLLREERAFERTYEKHVGDVYHYALAVLTDPVDAEEVTHTTFRNAYREFRSRGGRAPRLNGLLALAHEVCRVRGRHPRPAESDFAMEEPDVRSSCDEAEVAVLRRLDDGLSWNERRLLRTHLRACEDCKTLALGHQAQREAIRSLAAIPLPDTLQEANRKFLRPAASPR